MMMVMIMFKLKPSGNQRKLPIVMTKPCVKEASGRRLVGNQTT